MIRRWSWRIHLLYSWKNNRQERIVPIHKSGRLRKFSWNICKNKKNEEEEEEKEITVILKRKIKNIL